MVWLTIITEYVGDLLTSPAVKTGVGIFITTMAGFLGLSHPAISALVALMVLDYVLGAAHAWKENRLSFSRLMRGLGKFIVYVMAINITWLADMAMSIDSVGLSLRSFLCAYLAANEALSALSHLGAFGVPIPAWLMNRLRTYRKSVENHPDSAPVEVAENVEWQNHKKPQGGGGM